jgi:hypothetical protein
VSVVSREFCKATADVVFAGAKFSRGEVVQKVLVLVFCAVLVSHTSIVQQPLGGAFGDGAYVLRWHSSTRDARSFSVGSAAFVTIAALQHRFVVERDLASTA